LRCTCSKIALFLSSVVTGAVPGYIDSADKRVPIVFCEAEYILYGIYRAMADQKHDDEGDIDQLLAQFDGAREFGPCLDITRMERWDRADKYGCNPPLRVRDILVRDLADNKPPRYQMPNMSSSAPKKK
jgi:hypothetical protein